ncbi:MAG: hypothetical protein ABW160_06315, partial [Candidatus Thiodiazotropha sp. 4PDIV1]
KPSAPTDLPAFGAAGRTLRIIAKMVTEKSPKDYTAASPAVQKMPTSPMGEAKDFDYTGKPTSYTLRSS